MAIDCDIEPRLHIPHIAVPYDDQKLMENFQAIQRWADRLHINCSGCDCDEGAWTITPSGEKPDDGFTSAYFIDIASTMSTVELSGTIDSGTREFTIFINGVSMATLPLSTPGPFSETWTVGQTLAAGDELIFQWVGNADDPGFGTITTFTCDMSNTHDNVIVDWIAGG